MLELYITVHVTLESEFGDLFLHGQLILHLSLHPQPVTLRVCD